MTANIFSFPGSVRVQPTGSFRDLSRHEVSQLLDASSPELRQLFRGCALAVMNGGAYTDDVQSVFDTYRDFRIDAVQEYRGIELEVTGAPASAFVDGEMVRGIRDLLYAVLRDILFVNVELTRRASELSAAGDDEDAVRAHTTDLVFAILRNAGVLRPHQRPNLIVCWGGHSIPRNEYEYTKEVGYALGLRGIEICTGCGPGAMKGPMKGANIGHAKQRTNNNRYLGITEPGIIAAESPNPIVNELVIMPDIEKRLEAFVRAGHGIVVFPGGVGTAEEILYILGLLMDERNADIPFPLVLTGPASAQAYFEQIDAFIQTTLGEEARQHYEIIIDDPRRVARTVKRGLSQVEEFRAAHRDAWHFNWSLHVPRSFQMPFEPTHQSMAALELDPALPGSLIAANLRRAFSGIVAGNIKPDGVRLVRDHGPFEIHGGKALMSALDDLLQGFAAQGRMKLGSDGYIPCYVMR
jgi:pyrimidine/purine-5'-nucleotide nucleosidase